MRLREMTEEIKTLPKLEKLQLIEAISNMLLEEEQAEFEERYTEDDAHYLCQERRADNFLAGSKS